MANVMTQEPIAGQPLGRIVDLAGEIFHFRLPPRSALESREITPPDLTVWTPYLDHAQQSAAYGG